MYKPPVKKDCETPEKRHYVPGVANIIIDYCISPR